MSNWKRSWMSGLALTLTSAFMAFPTQAKEVWLRAETFTQTFPGGRIVTMWGYSDCDSTFTSCGTPSSPGPVIRMGTPEDVDPTTLTIHLQNELPVDTGFVTNITSLHIPTLRKSGAQPLAPVTFTPYSGSGDTRPRIRSFDMETAQGAVTTYIWSDVPAGTHFYHSGTHVQVQLQMGLYGAVVKSHSGGGTEGSPGTAYDPAEMLTTDFDLDRVIVYGEVDPELHDAVSDKLYAHPACPGGSVCPTSTEDYRPAFFTVNGVPSDMVGETTLTYPLGSRVLLRTVNAGLKSHAPQMLGGYFDVLGEDGHAAPTRRIQHTTLLPAAKTQDLLFTSNGDSVVLIDRTLRIDSGAPMVGDGLLAQPDSGSTFVGSPSLMGNLFLNDSLGVLPTDVTAADQIGGAALTIGAAEATLSGATVTINADGTFSYLPGSAGTETFNYTITDTGGGTSSSTLEITTAAAPPFSVTAYEVAAANYTNRTVHDVSWPLLSAGERLVAAIVTDNTPTFTMPAGFVSRGAVNASGAMKTEIFELDFNGSNQPVGPVISSVRQILQMSLFVVTGHDPIYPIEVATNASTMSGGNSNTIGYPTITPSWGALNTLWLQIGGFDGGGNHAFTGQPGSYTNTSLVNTRAGGVGRTSGYMTSVAPSETPGDATFDGGADQWVALSVAMRLAGPAPNLTPLASPDTDTASVGGGAVAGDLLANDDLGNAPTTVTVADQVGGSALVIGAAETTLAGAMLTVNADGSYSYLPGSIGTETFNYTIMDGDGETSSSTLEIVTSIAPPFTVTTSEFAVVGYTNTATHNVTWPTLGAGERLIVAVVTDNAPTITLPAGFISRGDVRAFGAMKTEIFELDFNGSNQPVGPIMTSNTQILQVSMFVLTGHDATEAIQVATNASTMSGGNSNTILYPTVTPTWGAANTLWLQVGGFDGGGSDPFTSQPAGYTNTSLVQSRAGGVGRTSGYMASIAGSETPGNATFGGAADQWVALSVAVRLAGPAPNLTPSASSDADSAFFGGPAATGNVMTNDALGNPTTTVTAADQVGGTAASIGIAKTTLAGATLTINADGSYSYTPGAAGTETFNYTITDNDGEMSSSTLEITTSGGPPDLMPSASPDTNTATFGGAAVTGNLMLNDGLGDTPTTVTSAEQLGGLSVPIGVGHLTTPLGAIVTISADGSYSYTPGAVGTEMFNYTITDDDGDPSSSTLEVTTNVAPAFSVATSSYATPGGNQTSHAVTWPTLSAGDRLIAVVLTDDNPTITMPAGFVSRGFVNAWGAISGEAFELDFNGANQPVGPMTTSKAERLQVTMFVISGHDTGQIIELATNFHGIGGGPATTLPYPTMAPSWGAGSPTLWLQVGAFNGDAGSPHVFTSQPAGYTNTSFVQASDKGVGRTSGWMTSTAASETPGNATFSGGAEKWLTMAIAVRLP